MERLTLKPKEYTYASIMKTHDEPCCDICESQSYNCNGCPVNEAIEKLAEYEDLEEKGLLVKLPCKVGDTVYVIPSKANYGLNIVNGYRENNRIYEQIVSEIRFFKNDYLLSVCDGFDYCHSQFYKINWFLTKESAQKALEGMKHE